MAKLVVVMSKRAAEMTGMQEGELSDGVRVRLFEPDAVLDSQERRADDPLNQALTQAARLEDGFVLVAIGLPRVSETQVPAVRERIAKLVQAIQGRAKELGKEDANRTLPLPNRVRILGVYQGDSPPPYVMELPVVPASHFLEHVEEILSALTESMPALRPPEQGAGRLRLPSRPSQNQGSAEGQAPTIASSGEETPSEEQTSSPQPGQRSPRLRLRIGPQPGPALQRPASVVPSSPSRLPLPAEPDEGARVLVVSQEQIPTVAIRYPIQIKPDGIPDVGSRPFRELEDLLRKELGRRRITIPPGSPVLGIGAGSGAIFRLVTYPELDRVDGVFVIVVDEATEHEAAYSLSRMGTKPQDAVTVVYAGSNPGFLSYVSSIGFHCETVQRGRIAEAVARAAANMLAGRIPDVNR